MLLIQQQKNNLNNLNKQLKFLTMWPYKHKIEYLSSGENYIEYLLISFIKKIALIKFLFFGMNLLITNNNNNNK